MLDLKTVEKLLKASKKKLGRGGCLRVHYQILEKKGKDKEHFLSDSHWAIRLPEHCIPAEIRLTGPGSYTNGDKMSNTPADIVAVAPAPSSLAPISPKTINDFEMLAVTPTVSNPRDETIIAVYVGKGKDSPMTFLDRDYLLILGTMFDRKEMGWFRTKDSPKGCCILRALPNPDIAEEFPDEKPWEAILMPVFK